MLANIYHIINHFGTKYTEGLMACNLLKHCDYCALKSFVFHYRLISTCRGHKEQEKQLNKTAAY